MIIILINISFYFELSHRNWLVYLYPDASLNAMGRLRSIRACASKMLSESTLRKSTVLLIGNLCRYEYNRVLLFVNHFRHYLIDKKRVQNKK